MEIILGCKRWSRNHQYGFRIYVPDIRKLGTILIHHPSSNNNWSSFSTFRDQVIAGYYPPAYSRSATITDGKNSINVSVTFAHHGRTFQGYITALLDTWLMNYVTSRMDTDLKCEYLVRSEQDFILIPSEANSVYEELDKKAKIGNRKVSKLLKKSHGKVSGQNTVEIGLYFELLEYERLKTEFTQSSYKVIHRYPSINSNIQLLKQNNISCDIDVANKDGEIVKCVEVKSVRLDEETPFNLTLREWDSRVWCRRRNIPYEIVVYHHFRYQNIRRVVIEVGDKLKRRPSGYYCLPVNS